MVKHEQLWAPWRLSYVKRDSRAQEAQRPPAPDALERDCFICGAIAQRADRDNLIAERARHSLVLLNRFPYNNGHLLIAPLRHVGRPDLLTTEEHLEGQELIARYIGILERLINAEGFNVGLNLGRVAGAGLPGHLHWHVVPRWNGDTNFMPLLAAIDVIPQALEALWEMLREELGTSKS